MTLSPAEPVTQAQAARMTAAILGLGGADTAEVMGQADQVPVWARSSVSSLAAQGLYQVADGDAPLTRREAALLLYRARCWADDQKEGASLLSWASK